MAGGEGRRDRGIWGRSDVLQRLTYVANAGDSWQGGMGDTVRLGHEEGERSVRERQADEDPTRSNFPEGGTEHEFARGEGMERSLTDGRVHTAVGGRNKALLGGSHEGGGGEGTGHLLANGGAKAVGDVEALAGSQQSGHRGGAMGHPFAGYQSWRERRESFEVQREMKVHCG